MHDAQLDDITCTHQDIVDERDVVLRELCQFLSEASWASVDEILRVKSVALARLQLYHGLKTIHP